MSKILFINSVSYGSTGRICLDLYNLAQENGFECCLAFGRGNNISGYNTIKIGTNYDVACHVFKSRLLDKHAFGSKHATLVLLREIEEYNPDIIHLHNLHGYYINIEVLTSYLKERPNIKVVWTLHDCWSFTGHCAHFLSQKCTQWKTMCRNCPNILVYPKSYYSDVESNFKSKKNMFSTLENLVIVTPSYWLENLVLDSFLNKHKVIIIHNGIDIQKFNNSPKNSIKENKTNILGVSNVWNSQKGIDDFTLLANMIDQSKYQITLIGVTEKQKKLLPDTIKCYANTKNIDELALFYQSADVFFNPTKEDNYPTVNLEAQACGTPVVTYNVGGTNETIHSSNCYVINELKDFIELLNNNNFKTLKKEIEVNRDELDKNILLKQYIKLYEELL